MKVEEERYTNKVIEAFKTGTLQLSSTDKNITLRAYLAEKLGCDPMRITKKFTGASCLGKRVYRSDKVIHNRDETVENDRQQLESLERDFLLKLQQTTNKPSSKSSMTYHHQQQSQHHNTHTISTPAIDALILQSRRLSNKEPTNGIGSQIGNGPNQLSSQTSMPDILSQLHQLEMTHDQFLMQLTEEAARVLVGRRAAQREQTSASQSNCGEDDDEAGRRQRQSSNPFKNELYQNQQSSFTDDVLLPVITNESLLMAQFREGTLTADSSHFPEAECAFDKTLFSGCVDETVRFEEPRHDFSLQQSGETETGVRSLLGFYQQHNQEHLSSLPHRNSSLSFGTLEGGRGLRGDLPGSSPSNRSEESDVSALSTEAVSGCL
jgi:hypothetical protein